MDELGSRSAVRIEAGRHYFGARCPATERTFAVAPDPSCGDAPYRPDDGNVLVACPHCDKVHWFPVTAIFAFLADGTE